MQLKPLTVPLLCLMRYILSSSLLRDPNERSGSRPFLINDNELFSRRNGVLQIGIFCFNSTEVSSTFAQWFPNRHIIRAAGGIRILTAVPTNAGYTPKFSDSIIFLDHLNANTSAELQPLLNRSNIWDREARYVLVLTSDFKGGEEALKHHVKRLWADARLINFLVVCKDRALTYNPFRDEILNFPTDKNHTSAQLFPNKIKNLHGHALNVSYVLAKLYVYKRDDQLTGLDYDFVATFLKTINATARLTEKPKYADVGNDVFYGTADLAASAMYLFGNFAGQAAYPHGFVDNVVLVQKPRTVPPLASLAHIFDVYTWLMIAATFAVFRGVKLCFGAANGTFGMKILTIAFAIFSIIVMQVVQSLITTILINPKPVKMINTINDLADSKLPIHVLKYWRPHVTTQLADQYIFEEEDEDYIGKVLNGTATGTGYVMPDIRNGKHLHKYHRVQEPIGTNYMTFYLGHRSPYRAALKDIVLRALAYGFYSKEWGAYEANTPPDKKTFRSLKLSHFDGVLRAWCCGIVSSTVVFIGELSWYHWVVRRQRNR